MSPKERELKVKELKEKELKEKGLKEKSGNVDFPTVQKV